MSKIRVLIAKVGLDGHDVGARVVARALRDAGMEVVYTGLRQTPQQVVLAALQEDVDCIGVSTLSGGHVELLPRVCQLLRDHGEEDIFVVAGGVIPAEDIPDLKAAGVAEVFLSGTSTQEIVEYIRDRVNRRREGDSATPGG